MPALLLLLVYVLISGYSKYKQNLLDSKDIQNQINYSQNTKEVLDNKPFIKKLPYKSQNFDVYYSTVKDEVQIIMKNNGLNYEDAKKANEQEINVFLKGIGVPDYQNIVWLLEQ